MREAYKSLEDTIKAILKNDRKNSDSYLETLNVIANLMNENNSGRFHGASYTRTFKHDRLTITLQFSEK